MSTANHHHLWIDTGSALVFGLLMLTFMAIIAMLQTCSSVLANLPHR